MVTAEEKLSQVELLVGENVPGKYVLQCYFMVKMSRGHCHLTVQIQTSLELNSGSYGKFKFGVKCESGKVVLR